MKEIYVKYKCFVKYLIHSTSQQLFPGLVCSVGFLILHCVGHRKIGKIPPTSVVAYFFILLFFYPVVPIVCCAYSFVTARKVHIAMLAKLFEGFLDDGPQ